MIPFKSLVSDSNLALVPVAYVELVSPEGRCRCCYRYVGFFLVCSKGWSVRVDRIEYDITRKSVVSLANVILEQKNSTLVEDRMQQRLYFLFPGMGGKAILASAWIDQRLGVIVILEL